MALLGGRKARLAAHRAVDEDDHVVAEGPVLDLGMGGASAYLVVTRERFLLAYVRISDVVVNMPFSHVRDVSRGGTAIKLTSEDPGYAELLNDSRNPLGETDAILDLRNDDALAEALAAGVRNGSRFWENWRMAPVRLAARKTLPMSSWQDCPRCGAELFERSMHSSRCLDCDQYFSEPRFQPQVEGSGPHYGRLLGDEPFRALSSEMDMLDWPTAWILRPEEFQHGPLLVMNGELMERVLQTQRHV